MRSSIKHRIVLFTVFAFLFVVGLETTLAQQLSTFEGSVTSIATSWPARGIITVKGDKGDVLVFAVGHRTVYVPSRYPGVGERVKISYAFERGQNAAYTIEILTAPPAKSK